MAFFMAHHLYTNGEKQAAAAAAGRPGSEPPSSRRQPATKELQNDAKTNRKRQPEIVNHKQRPTSSGSKFKSFFVRRTQQPQCQGQDVNDDPDGCRRKSASRELVTRADYRPPATGVRPTDGDQSHVDPVKDDDLERLEDIDVIKLCIPEDSHHGIQISGGLEYDAPVTISHLSCDGVAFRSGGLDVGDIILCINGVDVSLARQEDVVSLLDTASLGHHIVLTIKYSCLPPMFTSPGRTISKRIEILLSLGGVSDGSTSGESEDRQSDNGDNNVTGVGFGFYLRGGMHRDPEQCRPLTVTRVIPGSPADREGTLRPGDRIISIDGIDVSRSRLIHAVSLLTSRSTSPTADRSVILLVEYDVNVIDCLDTATGPCVVEIDKAAGTVLDVTLADVKSGQDGQSVVIIDSVYEAGTADRSGAIHVGDRLLSVDGVNATDKSAAEVTSLIQSNRAQRIRLELLPVNAERNRARQLQADKGGYYVPSPSWSGKECMVGRRPDSDRFSDWDSEGSVSRTAGSIRSMASQGTGRGYSREPPAYRDVTPGSCLSALDNQSGDVRRTALVTLAVELPADAGDLGVTVTEVTGSEVMPGVRFFVSSLVHGGLAEETSTLRVGDGLLSVDDVPLDGRTLEDVVRLLDTADWRQPTTIKIRRVAGNSSKDKGRRQAPEFTRNQPTSLELAVAAWDAATAAAYAAKEPSITSGSSSNSFSSGIKNDNDADIMPTVTDTRSAGSISAPRDPVIEVVVPASVTWIVEDGKTAAGTPLPSSPSLDSSSNSELSRGVVVPSIDHVEQRVRTTRATLEADRGGPRGPSETGRRPLELPDRQSPGTPETTKMETIDPGGHRPSPTDGDRTCDRRPLVRQCATVGGSDRSVCSIVDQNGPRTTNGADPTSPPSSDYRLMDYRISPLRHQDDVQEVEEMIQPKKIDWTVDGKTVPTSNSIHEFRAASGVDAPHRFPHTYPSYPYNGNVLSSGGCGPGSRPDHVTCQPVSPGGHPTLDELIRALPDPCPVEDVICTSGQTAMDNGGTVPASRYDPCPAEEIIRPSRQTVTGGGGSIPSAFYHIPDACRSVPGQVTVATIETVSDLIHTLPVVDRMERVSQSSLSTTSTPDSGKRTLTPDVESSSGGSADVFRPTAIGQLQPTQQNEGRQPGSLDGFDPRTSVIRQSPMVVRNGTRGGTPTRMRRSCPSPSTDHAHHVADNRLPPDSVASSSSFRRFDAVDACGLDRLTSRGPRTVGPDGSVNSQLNGRDADDAAGLVECRACYRAATVSVIPEMDADADDVDEAEQERLCCADELMENVLTPTPVELVKIVLYKKYRGGRSAGILRLARGSSVDCGTGTGSSYRSGGPNGVDEPDDFGFSLSDGLYEKGVFVSAIRPGGPAATKGGLHMFDRILQVNRTSTRDLNCHQVAPLIARSSGNQVQLIVCRNALRSTMPRPAPALVSPKPQPAATLPTTRPPGPTSDRPSPASSGIWKPRPRVTFVDDSKCYRSTVL